MTIGTTSWLGMKFVILVVCHHIVDFVLAFAYMKPWCAYWILQYACPNCKTILVQEMSTSNCIFCHQICLWNHYILFFPFCCFMHVGSDWVGCRHWVSTSCFETYGKKGCATKSGHCFGLLEWNKTNKLICCLFILMWHVLCKSFHFIWGTSLNGLGFNLRWRHIITSSLTT